MSKTIINCWVQRGNGYHINTPGPGLGDLIRGTLYLYQLCKKNKYNYIVDTHKHPVSLYLKYSKSRYSDLLDTIPDNEILFFNHNKNDPRNFNNLNVEQYITNSNNNLIILNTNNFLINDKLTDDEIIFIKKLLEPTDELNNEINDYLKNIPVNYNILHFRIGDDDIIYNIHNKNKYYNYLTIINDKYEENDLFVCDSNIFKNFVKEHHHIKNLMLDGCHIGFHTDKIKIKNTLIEFYIITKCNKIKSHNTYGSGSSGFVKLISLCYDISLSII